MVAIDGKTVRCRHDRGRGRGPRPHVSAWVTGPGRVRGHLAVADQSNEIAAIPALLDALEVAGAVVAIDAMGCQQRITRRVRERGAACVLALKDNPPTRHELVAHHFAVVTDDAAGLGPAAHATVDQGHGRLVGQLSPASRLVTERPRRTKLSAVRRSVSAAASESPMSVSSDPLVRYRFSSTRMAGLQTEGFR